MESEIRYRWIDGPTASDADWEKIESILASRGWTSLNKNTPLRILIAERDGAMGFLIFQWLPYCGPLFVPPSMRGIGVAQTLATKMFEFLVESEARGWIVAADSPHTAKMCESFGMQELKSPLYVIPNPGGLET